jgi:hypothetical protein
VKSACAEEPAVHLSDVQDVRLYEISRTFNPERRYKDGTSPATFTLVEGIEIRSRDGDGMITSFRSKRLIRYSQAQAIDLTDYSEFCCPCVCPCYRKYKRGPKTCDPYRDFVDAANGYLKANNYVQADAAIFEGVMQSVAVVQAVPVMDRSYMEPVPVEYEMASVSGSLGNNHVTGTSGYRSNGYAAAVPL